MNTIKKCIFIICLFLGIQQGYSQNIEQKINTLISTEDYLELNRQYAIYEDSIPPLLKAIISPLLSSAFNKPEKAANEIDFLLNNYVNELGDNALNFIAMLGQQLYYIGEYKAAATILGGVITSLQKQNTPNEIISPLENLYKKNRALENVHKSVITRLSGISNKINILSGLKSYNNGWYISGILNGKHESFLLDTGAGVNLVSECFAKKHNIKIVLDSIPILGVEKVGYTKMGVIDSINIGNIIYSNVIVNIAEDILPKHIQDSIGYKIDAILGLDFMKAIGRMIIYPQKNIIEFPEEIESDSNCKPNMMIVNNTPFVECTSNNLRLILNYDTGLGAEGYITDMFYENNKTYFKNILILDKKESRLGGFAGTKQYKSCRLSSFPICIGETQRILNQFEIQNICNQYSGGLGIKAFKLFNKIELNFKNMQLLID